MTALSRDSLRILALAGDAATRDILNAVFEAQPALGGMVAEAGGDDSGAESPVEMALARLRAGTAPTLLVLDLSGEVAPAAALGVVREAAGNGLKIVALGMENDIDLYRALLRAGASDYLVKPLEMKVLAASLQAALAGGAGSALAPKTPLQGRLALFFGCRGGIGTTTCALNTAWILAETFRKPTALVDLDTQFGTTALALDIDPGRGLREALERPERIDGLLIERAMIRQNERLAVLAAEESLREAANVAPEAIEILLKELCRKFEWVVAEIPRSLTASAGEAIAAASHLVIVVEPTLAGLREAIRLTSFFREERPPPGQVLLVDAGAGRAPRTQITRGEFEKGIGRKFDLIVPFDPKAAAAGANAGRALAGIAPGSPAAKAFRDLVALLGGPAPTRARGLGPLRRWFGGIGHGSR